MTTPTNKNPTAEVQPTTQLDSHAAFAGSSKNDPKFPFASEDMALESLFELSASTSGSLTSDYKPTDIFAEYLEQLQTLEFENAPMFGKRRLLLQRPSNANSFAFDRDVFGHGYNIRNTREILMIELLLVLNSQNKQDPFSKELQDDFGRVYYIKRKQLLLRRILFNNPYLHVINAIDPTGLSGNDKWDLWLKLFIEGNKSTPTPSRSKKDATETDHDSDESVNSDDASTNTNAKNPKIFTYTRRDFEDIEKLFSSPATNGFDFEQFTQAVDILYSWSINLADSKKWIYKYLFPFGSETIFYELSSTQALGTDIEFVRISPNSMAGGGEILFSMLQHACSGASTATTPDSDVGGIGHKLRNIFFSDNNIINSYAEILSGKQSLYERKYIELLQGAKSYADIMQIQKENSELQEIRKNLKEEEKEEKERINQDPQHFSEPLATRLFLVQDQPVFQRLAKDFANLLSLSLSEQDMFNSLSVISTLNLMVFLSEVGQGAMRIAALASTSDTGLDTENGLTENRVSNTNIDMVVMVKAHTRNGLRSLSINRLSNNNALLFDCLWPYAKAHAREFLRITAPFLLSEELNEKQSQLCNLLLNKLFLCNADLLHPGIKEQDADADESENTVAQLNNSPAFKSYSAIENRLSEVIKASTTFTKDHQHYNMGRSIGLITGPKGKGVTSSFYTLSDELLRTLVFTVLGPKRNMLFSSFLKRLEQRYHLIISPQEGNSPYLHTKEWQNGHFTKNINDCKEQLRRLNMLISLSDGCDYVCNPYGYK